MALIRLILAMVISLIGCLPASAEVKTFVVTAKGYIGDNQTKNDARNLATLEAKRKALEQAGTYVESLTIVKNSVVDKDEILALTAGVAETEILAEKAIVSEGSFGFEVTARITVETSPLEKKVKNFLNNRQSIDREKQLIKRNKDLESELVRYKQRLAKIENRQEVQRLRDTEGQKIEDKISATAWFTAGYQASDRKEFEEAISHYSKAISLDPNYAEAYNNRGNSYMGIHKYRLSLDDYNKALELNPNSAIAYTNRGNNYCEINQCDKAIIDHTKAISINPKFSDAYNNRGHSYSSLGQYIKAINDFSKSIDLAPSDADTYNNRGLIYYKIGQYRQAIEDYNVALKFDPNNADFYKNRGSSYYKIGRYWKSIDDYEESINLNPDDPAAYYNRALSYNQLNESQKALDDFRRSCQLGLEAACSTLRQNGLL